MFTRRMLMAGVSATAALTLIPRAGQAAPAGLPPAPTPAQWAKSPAFSHVCISPDGTQLASISENGKSKLLSHFDLKSGHNQAFDIGPTKVHTTMWIDNDHICVVRSFAYKKSAYMGLRNNGALATVYNVRKKSLVTLFEDTGGLGAMAGSYWGGLLNTAAMDGQTCIIANYYQEERQTLVRFKLDESRFDILDVGGIETGTWVVGPDGRLIGRSDYYVDKKTWVLSTYDGGHWRQVLTRRADTDIPQLLGVSRDGQSLLVFLYNDAEAGAFYDVAPDGKVSGPIDAPGVQPVPLFDQVTRRHDGFYTNTNSPYYYFDPAMQDIVTKAEKAVEGYRMTIIDRANDPRRMVLYTEGDDDAGTYYLVDFAAGSSQPIGSCYPDIPVEWITSKASMKYKAADGLEIEAYLTLPPNREAKALPLVVFPHGGPFARDDITLDTQAQTFASQGYAVFQPNFRGSDGYGVEFLKAGYGEWGGKMQSDLSDGVKALVAKGLVDPKRVCIVGISYGGYAALAGAIFDKGIYNCAVDISGVSDVTAWLELQRSYLSEVDSVGYNYLKRYLGNADTRKISPINYAGQASIPIMIAHGRDDSRVPFKQSETMVAALKSAGKDVTFLALTHTDHNETDEAERVMLMNGVVDFIQRHNPAGA